MMTDLAPWLVRLASIEDHSRRDASTMEFEQAREAYLRWLDVTRNLSEHTLRAYSSDLKLLERHVGACTPIRSLSADSLFEFLESQRRSGLTTSTIRRRACSLRGYCSWLVTEELLPRNPWNAIRLDMRRPRHLPRPVPSHELRQLLVHLSARAGLSRGDGSFSLEHSAAATTLLSVALMVATGVRVGEVVAICERDIDIPHRQLRIRGKGSRERQVYLPNDWVAALTASYGRLRCELKVEQPRFLFNRHGDPMSTGALRTRISKASSEAHLAHPVTPHMLRHSAATELIEAGVDIRYVQRLLGHASLSTTEIYTHVADRSLRRVLTEADVLGRALQVC